jgi:hypothetical protein
LIDEFQDTDPVQYSIFSRIYDGSSAPVAFIGDPKQAIYAFRGADVFTYMKAASAATEQFTLTTNWRSETRLIDAVNTIFDREKPFLLDEIKFDRVSPGPKADEKAALDRWKARAAVSTLDRGSRSQLGANGGITGGAVTDKQHLHRRRPARTATHCDPHEHERSGRKCARCVARSPCPKRALQQREYLRLARSA